MLLSPPEDAACHAEKRGARQAVCAGMVAGDASKLCGMEEHGIRRLCPRAGGEYDGTGREICIPLSETWGETAVLRADEHPMRQLWSAVTEKAYEDKIPYAFCICRACPDARLQKRDAREVRLLYGGRCKRIWCLHGTVYRKIPGLSR